MKNFLMHILLPFFLGVLNHGCLHQKAEEIVEDVPCQYFQSIEELKEWYHYKVGSYWVYKEVNSGILDTMIVRNSSDSYIGDECTSFTWAMSNPEDFARRVISFNVENVSDCFSRPTCNCYEIKWNYIQQSGGLAMGNTDFIFPHIPGNSHPMEIEGESTVTAVYYDMIIQDSLYKNVVVQYVEESHAEGPPGPYRGVNVEFTIAKNHFIIRKRFPLIGQDWQLVEHVIVQ